MAVALVTGTSAGIGLATAITLGRAGHTVFAGMRSLDRGDALQAAIAKEKLPVTIVQMDVDNDASVDRAVSEVVAKKGQIDVLVNNAGIGGGGPVEEAPIAIFRQVMETNFFGGLRCIKAVVTGMRTRRSGCIVNVTSAAGRFGMSPQAAYAASKWAVEGFSECLAQELKAFNVRVAIVEPGVIETAMATRSRPAMPESPYDVPRRRLRAFFEASLRSPTSPFVVAEQIRDIVGGTSWQLRYPTGRGAATLIKWRRDKTDEQWVNLGVASDAEWAADAKSFLGLDVA
jgi:NAD(P)-dependent dehydrogenase (short-subunit alcohol dehydrogenase family)